MGSSVMWLGGGILCPWSLLFFRANFDPDISVTDYTIRSDRRVVIHSRSVIGSERQPNTAIVYVEHVGSCWGVTFFLRDRFSFLSL